MTSPMTSPPKVLLVGLGAMGSGMYATLSKSNDFDVIGYDIYKPCMDRIAEDDPRQSKIKCLLDVNEAFGG